MEETPGTRVENDLEQEVPVTDVPETAERLDEESPDVVAEEWREPRYAGFWIRVAAYVIDTTAISIAVLPLSIYLQKLSSSTSEALTAPDGSADLDLGTQTSAFTDNLEVYAYAGFFSLLVTLLYYALMESSQAQATLGKLAVGLRVVDAHGQRIGLGRAIGRRFAWFLSAIVLYIGFIMIGLDRCKRGLHDRIAKTYVVYRDKA